MLRRSHAFLLIYALLTTPVLAGATLQAIPVTLDCKATTLSDCIEKISINSSVSIQYPENLRNAQVSVRVPSLPLGEALKRILDAAGLSNYSLLENVSAKSLAVLIVGDVPEQAVATSSDSAAQALSPGQANDTDLSLPAGMPSDAQVSIILERAQLAPVDLDAPLFLDSQGQPVTLRIIQEAQARVGPQPAVIVPPDADISEEELTKIVQEHAKTAASSANLLPEAEDGQPGPTQEHLKKVKESEKYIEGLQATMPPEQFFNFIHGDK